jgi:UDP-glucose 4-epimerase
MNPPRNANGKYVNSGSGWPWLDVQIFRTQAHTFHSNASTSVPPSDGNAAPQSSIIVTGENAMKRWRVPYEIVAQRPGDVASCHADPATAVKLLGGQAEFRSERIRAERGRWQEKNALGFKD